MNHYAAPKVTGRIWLIPGPGGIAISVTVKKPNAFHRLMMRLLLGWIWEDEK